MPCVARSMRSARAARPPRRPGAPSTGTRRGTDDGAVAPLTDEERERREAEQIAKLREDARKIVLRYAPGLMKRRLTRIGAVKEKLGAIWDRRDARMSEVLDTQELEEYRETQKEWRAVYSKVLDDMAAARRER